MTPSGGSDTRTPGYYVADAEPLETAGVVRLTIKSGVGDGTSEMPELIGVCYECEDCPWFPVSFVGESCPGDYTEDREHRVTYYRRWTPVEGTTPSSTGTEAGAASAET